MVGHRRRRHLRTLALCLALAACASAPPRAPKSATYLRAVEARVEAASDTTRFVLRHNPATCDCPPYEVKLGEVWQRVELVGVDEDDATLQALDVAVSQAPDAEVVIEGHLDSELATCGLGTLYVSLVPTAFVGEPSLAAPPSSD